MKPAPFDRVVTQRNGTRVVYSFDEFLGLPLHERIQHVLQRDLSFFLRGVEIDRRRALDALRAWTTAK